MFERLKIFKKPIEDTKAPDVDFYVWFSEVWTATGGIITQATAADILGKTNGRIRQMIDEGKLKEYCYGTLKYVSFVEVYKIARMTAYNKMKQMLDDTLKELKDVPEQQEQVKAAYADLLKNIKRAAEIE